ncbi:hypothetical protein DCS_03024 [Drechmeria coniospora]|uniref:Enterotoxin n=1 Tax=Drechmeria coniospora TaxID=98403 RepID=A0A151GXS3_DRECN|nr:hypothetical protein DCS_03024 [Drechmeria coniospora]KYK61880.1 hypothetical protein DCS_03024 [Drechmeria coniospora]
MHLHSSLLSFVLLFLQSTSVAVAASPSAGSPPKTFYVAVKLTPEQMMERGGIPSRGTTEFHPTSLEEGNPNSAYVPLYKTSAHAEAVFAWASGGTLFEIQAAPYFLKHLVKWAAPYGIPIGLIRRWMVHGVNEWVDNLYYNTDFDSLESPSNEVSNLSNESQVRVWMDRTAKAVGWNGSLPFLELPSVAPSAALAVANEIANDAQKTFQAVKAVEDAANDHDMAKGYDAAVSATIAQGKIPSNLREVVRIIKHSPWTSLLIFTQAWENATKAESSRAYVQGMAWTIHAKNISESIHGDCEKAKKIQLNKAATALAHATSEAERIGIWTRVLQAKINMTATKHSYLQGVLAGRDAAEIESVTLDFWPGKVCESKPEAIEREAFQARRLNGVYEDQYKTLSNIHREVFVALKKLQMHLQERGETEPITPESKQIVDTVLEEPQELTESELEQIEHELEKVETLVEVIRSSPVLNPFDIIKRVLLWVFVGMVSAVLAASTGMVVQGTISHGSIAPLAASLTNLAPAADTWAQGTQLIRRFSRRTMDSVLEQFQRIEGRRNIPGQYEHLEKVNRMEMEMAQRRIQEGRLLEIETVDISAILKGASNRAFDEATEEILVQGIQQQASFSGGEGTSAMGLIT